MAGSLKVKGSYENDRDELNVTLPALDSDDGMSLDSFSNDLFQHKGSVSDSDSDASAGKLVKEIRSLKKELGKVKTENLSLRACVKISEEERLSCLKENNKLKNKMQSLKSHDDHLRRMLVQARDILDKGLQGTSSKAGGSETSVSTPRGKVRKSLEFSESVYISNPPDVSGFHFTSNAGSPTSFRKMDPSECKSSPSPSLMRFGNDDHEDVLQSPKKFKKSSSKSPAGLSAKSPSGLSRAEVKEIAEAVRRDILNEKPLDRDDRGRVRIGTDLFLSEKKWVAIKSQSKNSLFVTKLATSACGPNYLKERTVGKNKADSKKVATPAKVDHFVAALRGKLLADNPNMPNIDAAAEVAKKILAQKMQDEARGSRASVQGKKKL